MCVLAFAWQAHPRWRLVMAGNRDELHARPAAPLARWAEAPHILAGRDLASGGTWLGVSEEGRFAVVTNLRGYGPPAPDRASRGALVTDVLAGAEPEALDAFNPFNLIAADQAGARFLANRPGPVRAALAPGLYGLSNGALDAPWPKTLRLKQRLLDWIVAGADGPERLLDALAEDRLPTAGLAPAAPSDAPREPALSPVFIRDPVYGTRCGTVVAIDMAGRGTIVERRYDAAGAPTGETALSFAWPGANRPQ
jgi:uncharacterized protein with NRDE domain